MNHIYRTLWNTALGVCVAVAETAKGAGKGASSRSRATVVDAAESDGFTLKPACRAALMLLAALVLLAPKAHAANAADATVSLGAGSVTTLGNTTSINQASQRLAIDWINLSTRANEALVFAQPNAQAIALNRITGSSPSEFLGSLTANGQVFILNPNGVLFGAGSQVNVGGLVASTLNMSNADFQAGNHVFSNNGAGGPRGSVVNQGSLTAAPGGYLALLAPEVRNEGVMTASLGTALLAAGNKVTLNLDNGSLVGYSIDQGAISALAENKHLIQADGGQVLLSATAMDALTTATVNNTGVIEARTIQNKAGRIMLMGDMETGTVNVAGTLDASAPNGGDGGFIETSAAHVKVAPGARITTRAANGKTGKWLIDPQDYTIAASGGDITGADLSAQLVNNDVEIQSVNGAQAGNGDIHVNDNVSWSANKLTLTAERDINVNTVMSATGSASLALNTGATGSLNMKMRADGTGFDGKVDLDTTGTLHINGEQYTIIRDLGANANSMTGTDLQGMRANPNGRYVLGADIDASASASGSYFDESDWSDTYVPLAGFYGRQGMRPLSTAANPFTGKFDGLGHRISGAMVGLDLREPGNEAGTVLPLLDSTQPMGLFGAVAATGKIGNLVLHGLHNEVSTYVNGFWDMPPGQPHNNVVRGWYGAIGSLAGTNAGTLRNVVVNPTFNFSSAAEAAWAVGGVVGDNTGTIQNARVTPIALGGTAVQPVGNPKYLGGIAGINRGLIEGSHSDLLYRSQAFSTGGIAGFNDGIGVVRDSTASGWVESYGAATGGALGINYGLVERVHSSANVQGGNIVGGLIGHSNGIIRDVSASGAVDSREGPSSFADRYDPALGTWATDGIVGQARGAGGLVGAMAGGSIDRSFATGSVALNWAPANPYETLISAGGLVGSAQPSLSLITIRDSWASGNLSQIDGVVSIMGGFVGFMGTGTTIERAYSTGNVTMGRQAVGYVNLGGGFVGYAEHVTLRQLYATGNVYGLEGRLGGFAGQIFGSITSRVEDCYATGNVTLVGPGPGSLGGFVGFSRVPIFNSYTTGILSSPGQIWLFGETDNPANANLFYNVANQVANPGAATYSTAVGKTAAELTQAATFAGWDIASTGGSNAVWRIYEGHSMPLLRSFLTPLNLADAPNATQTYNGTMQTAAATAMVDAQLLGAAASGRNAGLYNGYYSTQQGYDISGGNLIITAANLVLTTTDVSKTYNGQLDAAGVFTATGGTQLFGADTATGGSFAFLDKNAGIGKTVTVGGATLNDGNSGGNYVLSYADNTTSTITPKALTYSTAASNKTYDGDNTATATLSGLTGLVGTETVTASAGATFNSKDVLTANTVTVNSATLADGSNGGLASNYSIAAGGTAAANITAKVLTYSTAASNKIYDGDNTATATLSGLTGLVDTETVTASAGATFNTKDVATANLVTVNSATLADGSNGGLASNYSIAAGGTAAANIMPKALTVTANDDSRLVGSTPYAGGNGVNYNGFVAGESVSALTGTLAYSGSSQGASAAGSYAITPGGYGATNYTLAYVDGVLSIRPVAAAAPASGGTALTPAYGGALRAVAGVSGLPGGPQSQNVFSGPDGLGDPDSGNDGAGGNGNENGNSNGGDNANARPSSSRVSVVSCGLLLPRGVNSAICE